MSKTPNKKTQPRTSIALMLLRQLTIHAMAAQKVSTAEIAAALGLNRSFVIKQSTLVRKPRNADERKIVKVAMEHEAAIRRAGFSGLLKNDEDTTVVLAGGERPKLGSLAVRLEKRAKRAEKASKAAPAAKTPKAPKAPKAPMAPKVKAKAPTKLPTKLPSKPLIPKAPRVKSVKPKPSPVPKVKTPKAPAPPKINGKAGKAPGVKTPTTKAPAMKMAKPVDPDLLKVVSSVPEHTHVETDPFADLAAAVAESPASAGVAPDLVLS